MQESTETSNEQETQPEVLFDLPRPPEGYGGILDPHSRTVTDSFHLEEKSDGEKAENADLASGKAGISLPSPDQLSYEAQHRREIALKIASDHSLTNDANDIISAAKQFEDYLRVGQHLLQ